MELWFLLTALPLLVIYSHSKCQVSIINTFKDMLQKLVTKVCWKCTCTNGWSDGQTETINIFVGSSGQVLGHTLSHPKVPGSKPL